MAIPIKFTPTLEGESARKFNERADKAYENYKTQTENEERLHLDKTFIGLYFNKGKVYTPKGLDILEKEEKELGPIISDLYISTNEGVFSKRENEYQYELLKLQHDALIVYRNILRMRIDDLKKTNN